MIKLTGMWLNQTKDGKQYFSGTLGGGRVLIFKNDHKEKDSQPDYNMFLAEIEKKDKPQESFNSDESIPF